MKTIGLIGGMSWYSTLEYYRVINELVQQRRGGHASALVSLQSLDFAEVRAMQQRGDWDGAARLLAEAGQRCAAGGADIVLICTNLMHRVADDVQAAIDVPLLHIADAIAERARREDWSRLGVLGARWVMEEDFYVGRLARAGLTVDVPGPEDRTEVDRDRQPLRHHPPRRVAEGGRVVHHILQHARVGGAEDHQRHLIDDRVERIREDLEADGIDRGRGVHCHPSNVDFWVVWPRRLKPRLGVLRHHETALRRLGRGGRRCLPVRPVCPGRA